MKKLLIIPVAAFLAAGSAAFAASLDVTTPPMQVGEANGSLECTQNADVTAWGYRDDIAPGVVVNAEVRLDADHECEGNRLYVTPLNEAGQPMGGAGSVLITDATSYRVQFGTSTGNEANAIPVSAVDLHDVRIAIDQGF